LGAIGGFLVEAPRLRKTAYRSGRLELLGFKKNPFKKKRKVKHMVFQPTTFRTPFKGVFRWKKY
jgi:hypothetical protein